jgi:gliding motility-associated-like protein
MRKFSYFVVLSVMLLCAGAPKASATHCAGAELLFQWLHDSTYQIFYKFYRDCAGVTQAPSVNLCYQNTGCTTDSFTAMMTPVTTLIPPGVINGSEVGRVCPGDSTTCTKPSSTIPGYREWWYSVNVTMPSRCNHWIFAVYQSARNSAINNLNNPGGQYLYTQATMDNLDAPGDTSPFFSVKPVPYICNNIPYSYNNGAYDINNDSMAFVLIQPESSINGSACTQYNTVPFATATPPYNILESGGNPLQCNNTFYLDTTTGVMNFTPDQIQIAVVTMRVDEYRNQIKIGSVMRDIQIIVQTCDIQQPVVNLTTATLTNASIASNGDIQACAGTPFSFCFTCQTADTNGILVVTDNSATVTPGAVVTYSNMFTDTVTGCFSWWPTVFDTGFKIFTVTVADSNCNASKIIFSQTFTLPIYIWPATNILDDTSICLGGSATLLAVGGGDFTWAVLPGGSALSTLSCTACNNPTATPTNTTLYVVTSGITNAICKNKDTVTVTVIPPVTVTIADTTTCVDNSLPLSVVVSPNNNFSIKWQPATGLSNDTIVNPIVSPPGGLPTITYVITVTAGGICATLDTFHLHVLQGFEVFNTDTPICLGKSVQVNALGDPSYFYSWSPTAGVSSPGSLTPVITPPAVSITTYVITASYPGCKDSLNSFKITVEPTPAVVAGANRQICSGDTVHLSPFVTPAYGYIYSWAPGGGLDNANIEDPIFSGSGTIHLTLTVTSPLAKCTSSDSTTIVVIKKSFLEVSPADTAICPYDTIQLHVFADSAVDVIQSFYWSPGTFISDTKNANPLVWPPSSSYYTAYGVDTAGCLDTLSLFINIRPAAILDIPDSVTIFPGDTYQINPGTNCTSFNWFPPLGLSADSISNPVASPTVNTKYIVKAKTEAGCTIEDSIKVYLASDSYINVPNVFTPGSGINNILYVVHLGEATLKTFTIYNRWGQKVFESNDISKGWDGTFNGQPQPVGVYVYSVEAYTYKGLKLVKNGNITLIR